MFLDLVSILLKRLFFFAVHDIPNILRFVHISKALNFLRSFFLIVQLSPLKHNISKKVNYQLFTQTNYLIFTFKSKKKRQSPIEIHLKNTCCMFSQKSMKCELFFSGTIFVPDGALVIEPFSNGSHAIYRVQQQNERNISPKLCGMENNFLVINERIQQNASAGCIVY